MPNGLVQKLALVNMGLRLAVEIRCESGANAASQELAAVFGVRSLDQDVYARGRIRSDERQPSSGGERKINHVERFCRRSDARHCSTSEAIVQVCGIYRDSRQRRFGWNAAEAVGSHVWVRAVGRLRILAATLQQVREMARGTGRRTIRFVLAVRVGTLNYIFNCNAQINVGTFNPWYQ